MASFPPCRQLTQVILIAILVLLMTNWEEEAKKAFERVLEADDEEDGEEKDEESDAVEIHVLRARVAAVPIAVRNTGARSLSLDMRGTPRVSTGLYVGSLT